MFKKLDIFFGNKANLILNLIAKLFKLRNYTSKFKKVKR